MRFLTFKSAGAIGTGILSSSGEIRGITAAEHGYPGSLDSLGAKRRCARQEGRSARPAQSTRQRLNGCRP
jgi:hypothetical protein